MNQSRLNYEARTRLSCGFHQVTLLSCLCVWCLSLYPPPCVFMCMCARNGHMIIHSHETIEDLLSYYGMITWSHTGPCCQAVCVCGMCVWKWTLLCVCVCAHPACLKVGMYSYICTACVHMCNHRVHVWACALYVCVFKWTCVRVCMILTESAAWACGWSWTGEWGWCCCCWGYWIEKNREATQGERREKHSVIKMRSWCH